jgi:hypothetical protein
MMSDTKEGYEVTVDSLGNWAICKAGAGDVIADFMTEDVANMIRDALNEMEDA